MNMKTIKFFAFLLLGAGTLWVGNSTYTYFTHHQKPHLSVEGFTNEGCYKGELKCALCSKNSYKIATIKAELDGQPLPLAHDGIVRSRNVKLPVSIDTTELADGKHTLTIEATDSSYHKNTNQQTWSFHVDNVDLRAAFLEESYSVAQGKTALIKIKANKPLNKATIEFAGNTFHMHEEAVGSSIYECFLPIDCEHSVGEEILSVNAYDAAGNSADIKSKLRVRKFVFKKQNQQINVQKKLAEEREVSSDSKILETAIERWAQDSPRKKLWNGPFEIPTQAQRIITPHGEIRVTPTRGRYMHKGIDVVNTPRSVVWAAQNGNVVIKERYLLTGNTVVIDHGLGVSTLYAHLEDFADIEVGDKIKKGNPVGRLGKTGYATGYHLHWELRVNGIAVDPLEWTKKVY